MSQSLDYNDIMRKLMEESRPATSIVAWGELSAAKHDGKLDEHADCTVDYSPKSKSGIYIRVLMRDDGAVLTPKQALSLLDWLQQERETLEKLAKEQS